MFDTSERAFSLQVRRFAFFSAGLVICFAAPLWHLLRFSFKSDFFSYIPLVPFISAYLIHLQRPNLPKTAGRSLLGAAFAAGAGLALAGGFLWLRQTQSNFDQSLYLAGMTASLLLLLLAGSFYFLGSRILRILAFPVAFLAFTIPAPDLILNPTITFFQYASAWTAVGMLKLVGTAVKLVDLTLCLSDINIVIAPECSGIHSTMVLLMTAFLAGHMFLKSRVRRAVLVAFVVPLAILRNGFRIFTISELCVHIGPEMIDSPIHHHGGPIFFALSLIPFFLLLVWLRKTERPLSDEPPGALAVSTTL